MSISTHVFDFLAIFGLSLANHGSSIFETPKWKFDSRASLALQCTDERPDGR